MLNQQIEKEGKREDAPEAKLERAPVGEEAPVDQAVAAELAAETSEDNERSAHDPDTPAA